ncbi:hypothetical protein MTO96_015571 [Rhipicephalus appendiculatus]
MDGEESVAPRRRALSFRRPAVVAAHGSSVIPPAPLSPRLRAVRHKAIGLIRRTLGSLSNSSTPVGSCESLPDAVFASSNHHHNNNNSKESPFPWGSPPSRPGTPTLAELLSAISSLPPVAHAARRLLAQAAAGPGCFLRYRFRRVEFESTATRTL